MLRYKTKAFKNRDGSENVRRYYLVDDVCVITGMTPREACVFNRGKGLHAIDGYQCLDLTTMSQLAYDYPALTEALENAQEVAHG